MMDWDAGFCMMLEASGEEGKQLPKEIKAANYEMGACAIESLATEKCAGAACAVIGVAASRVVAPELGTLVGLGATHLIGESKEAIESVSKTLRENGAKRIR